MAVAAAIAVASTAVLLAALAGTATTDVDVDVDDDSSRTSFSPSAIYLYRPLCNRTCVKQTYATCECVDVDPCNADGPYRYKFIKNNGTDTARAYLFTEPGCQGDVTVVKRTTGDCRNFWFHSVKVCPPLHAHGGVPAEADE